MLSFRLGEFTYTIPERFFPGHQCSPDDARVLNTAYAADMRTRSQRWAELGQAEPGTEEFRKLVEDEAKDFSFAKRKGKFMASAVERRALADARTVLGESADASAVTELATRPESLAKAREAITAEARVARELLISLLA